MKVRRFLARLGLNTWLHPTVELWLGCILLVLTAGFWISAARPIWDVHVWDTLGGAILGPLLVYNAWRRKPNQANCDTCGDLVLLTEIDLRGYSGKVDIDPTNIGRLFTTVCPRCGEQYYTRERFED